MSFLLDTNVLSEYVKPLPEERVVCWLNSADEDQLFVSVATLAELRFGVARMDHGSRRRNLEKWLQDEMLNRFDGRILSIDLQIADAWGEVMARCEDAGRRMGPMDCFLAATALVWDLTLVTRNTTDFASYGGAVFSPWESAS